MSSIEKQATDRASVAATISSFVQDKAGEAVTADRDLAAAGVLTSMVAMELVVFLESSFGVAVVGRDLTMDNFRTVDDMVALVGRLQEAP